MGEETADFVNERNSNSAGPQAKQGVWSLLPIQASGLWVLEVDATRDKGRRGVQGARESLSC